MLNKFSVDDILKKATEELEDADISRVYLGSAFCSQYFLRILPSIKKLLEYFSHRDIPVTLTLPIFSQKDLKTAKEEISLLLNENPIIDEITVNDLGMLSYLENETERKINLGRLFFKDPRDIRVTGHYDHVQTHPNTFSYLSDYGNIAGVEVDQISRDINFSQLPESIKNLALHIPYTYMTTGNICKFASIGKADEKKFRPNDNCSLQCQGIHEFFTETFRDSDEERELFRFGRTVYFLNKDREISGRQPDRLIYFPLKELALMAQERTI